MLGSILGAILHGNPASGGAWYHGVCRSSWFQGYPFQVQATLNIGPLAVLF